MMLTRQLRSPKLDVFREASLTVRTTKRIKGLAEIAALKYQLTLSNCIEQLLITSFDHVMVDQDDECEPDENGKSIGVKESKGRPLSQLIEELYDEDDAICLFKRLRKYSWALSREQHRTLKLIHISPVLYPKQGKYDHESIREHWTALDAVANGNASIDTLPANLFGNADVEFALMSETEQVAIWRSNPEEFYRRSKTHLTPGKGA